MKLPGRGKENRRNSEEEADAEQDKQHSAFRPPVAPPDPQRRLEIGEAIAQAIVTLDHGDIKKFSFVTKDEEFTFALWYSIADEYKLSLIKNFINTSLRLRVSIDGRGREDIVKIASAHIERETTERAGVVGRMRSYVGL